MSTNNSNFVDPPEDAPEFVVDSAKGAVIETTDSGGGRSYGDERTHAPPDEKFEDNRLLYDTDPHVGHAVEISLDWLLADGYNISERHIAGADEEMDSDLVARFRKLIANSNFNSTFQNWIEGGAVEGHCFMELVVEDEKFKPRLLPADRVYKFTNEFGVVEEYILEPPSGGGPESDDATKYGRHDVAEFYFRKNPLEYYGRSNIERIHEQADMLRDMEIDYARFIATKAYPPIFWSCGTEESEWSENQISKKRRLSTTSAAL